MIEAIVRFHLLFSKSFQLHTLYPGTMKVVPVVLFVGEGKDVVKLLANKGLSTGKARAFWALILAIYGSA